MFLELTDEQSLIRATARAFARAELEPLAAGLDREDDRPAFLANLKKLAGLGFMGLNVDGAYGGSEAGVVAFSVVRGTPAQKVVFKYHGKLDGDTITGTIERPGPNGAASSTTDWKATRAH